MNSQDEWDDWLAEQSTVPPRNTSPAGLGGFFPRIPPPTPVPSIGVDFEDLVVRTANPGLLDDTLQQLPLVLAHVIDDSYNGDVCLIRCFGQCAGFVRFALKSQGYGEVVE